MQIQDKAIVTYTAKWPYGTFAGFSDYSPAVYNDLASAGIAVQAVKGGFNLLNSLLGSPFDIQLTVQIQNGLGFGSEQDLINTISSLVEQESGNRPLTASVPYIKNPDSAAPVATGQSTGTSTTPSSHACGDPNWSFFDDPGQWLSCLTQKGLSSLGLVMIGLLVGVAFIVFSEHEARRV